MVLDQLVDLVVRPPRAEYDESDLLGPVLNVGSRSFKRHDVQLVNKRGHVLQCSHYRPADAAEEPLPCVIYCHGNSGCRADANDAVMVLLPLNVTVLAIDFAGSGQSQGEHVTLGKYEMEDLETAVDFLRAEGLAQRVGLWGRSMGAVTALLYGAKDPTVAGIVVDSPFGNLSALILELVDFYKIPVPKALVRLGVLPMMRRAIRQKASFDINDLDVLGSAPGTFIPALFAHADGDTFIHPHHSAEICDKYAGDKNRVTFPGDHNSPRPGFFYDSVAIFFHNVLEPPPVKWRDPGGARAAAAEPQDDGAATAAELLDGPLERDQGEALVGTGREQAAPDSRISKDATLSIGRSDLAAQPPLPAGPGDLSDALAQLCVHGPPGGAGSSARGQPLLDSWDDSYSDEEDEELARAIALSMQEAHEASQPQRQEDSAQQATISTSTAHSSSR